MKIGCCFGFGGREKIKLGCDCGFEFAELSLASLENASESWTLKTIWGVGYMIEEISLK